MAGSVARSSRRRTKRSSAPVPPSVVAEADGYRLEVEYPQVTRSALPMRWALTLAHPGGFGGKIKVATSIECFRLFDLNWLHPAPAEELSAGGRTIWVYDAPDGDSWFCCWTGGWSPA